MTFLRSRILSPDGIDNHHPRPMLIPEIQSSEFSGDDQAELRRHHRSVAAPSPHHRRTATATSPHHPVLAPTTNKRPAAAPNGHKHENFEGVETLAHINPEHLHIAMPNPKPKSKRWKLILCKLPGWFQDSKFCF